MVLFKYMIVNSLCKGGDDDDNDNNNNNNTCNITHNTESTSA